MHPLFSLKVFHLKKEKKELGSFLIHAASSLKSSFYLETCQRWIWVTLATADTDELEFKKQLPQEFEVYTGVQAYLFLLKLATGLESKIVGETDVFGQLKQAWIQAENSTCLDCSWSLAPIMKMIFEDAKEIRSSYLQNLGGSSYGTLVRKLIRDHKKKLEGPVFLIGAGKIAHSVAPFLLQSELWLWNRSEQALMDFQKSLAEKSHQPVRILSSEEEGWKHAAHVVVCIPSDPERDPQRIQWFQGVENRSVVHLGVTLRKEGLWESLPHFYSLPDLFELQDSIKNVRSVQVAQAIRVCEERAKLRATEDSISIPQSWQDLLSFA